MRKNRTLYKRNKTFHKKKIWIVFVGCSMLTVLLMGRLAYLMWIRSDYYYEKAEDLHERERSIKAKRGRILDAKGNVLADNKTVCTISVIHSQIKEPEKVIKVISRILGMEEEEVRKRVEKNSSIERIRTNVEKEVGDKIRKYQLAGIKVDEDYKRTYPYGTLASHVLGFTGSDNQGIIGLEVQYEDILGGSPGKILTTTDARGIELEEMGEERQEPVNGNDLKISIDINMQKYAQQAALKVMEEKNADRVSVILMNPTDGAVYACVNVPEFDLNDPFTLNTDIEQSKLTSEELQNFRNQMWRNPCLNDTYEPGSTFKIITMAAALEEGVVGLDDRFYCPGYKLVDDRRIHCANRNGHGSQNFVEGAENSCNPVFIEVGQRLGVKCFYNYFDKFGILKKTGIDLPGEAASIMHKKENMGNVELATVSFGQSFQITPIQLAATVSALINGGNKVTPHFGILNMKADGKQAEEYIFPVEEGLVSEETSRKVKYILEKVVSEGSGKNARIEGYTIGGKTATSQTLPRSANRYISSFLGFAPSEDPQILGLCIIHNPHGIYYGGTIAAPVIRSIFDNVLPYLGIEAKMPTNEDHTLN